MLKFLKRFINPFLCWSKGRFHTASVFFETVRGGRAGETGRTTQTQLGVTS